MRHPLPRREVVRQDTDLGEDLERTGAGNAADGSEQHEILAQQRVCPDDLDGLLLELLNPAVEVAEVDLDVVADGRRQLPAVLGGVEPVLLLRADLDQGGDASGEGTQCQGGVAGWLPAHEGHATHELQQCHGGGQTRP